MDHRQPAGLSNLSERCLSKNQSCFHVQAAGYLDCEVRPNCWGARPAKPAKLWPDTCSLGGVKGGGPRRSVVALTTAKWDARTATPPKALSETAGGAVETI